MKFLLFVIGCCVGSFLNSCIYRLPQRISLIKPRSSCPHCKTPLKWYENVPLLSFIILRGRCSHCRQRISLRYPFVELITAVLFVALYQKFGIGMSFFASAFFFCLLIVISFIDIAYHAIPIYLCFLGIVVGLGFSVAKSIILVRQWVFNIYNFPLITAIKGMIVGFGLAYLFKFFGDQFIAFYLAVRKKESIEGEKESLGLGDVDFLGMVGVFMGIQGAVMVFFIAPFLALFYALLAIIFRRSHLIPYLPYLSAASVVVFFWGNHIVRYFFKFLIG
ncbi:MAG: prepilin peptidase [Candidatus Omnitrophota bacterium]|nr:MAG: prepilin peptidase [Candidatus Omnitrophota bacterium]